MQGVPATKLGANFSSAPPIRKLTALMCTATPRRGTSTWVPANWPFLPSGMAGPSWIRLPDGSSLLPMLAYANRVPAPPSMSIQLSARVAPVWCEIAYSASLRSIRNLASAFRRAARCWKSSASSAGTPTRRARAPRPRARPRGGRRCSFAAEEAGSCSLLDLPRALVDLDHHARALVEAEGGGGRHVEYA